MLFKLLILRIKDKNEEQNKNIYHNNITVIYKTFRALKENWKSADGN